MAVQTGFDYQLDVFFGAIVAAHRTVGVPVDRQHYFIRSVLEGIARTKDRRPNRANPAGDPRPPVERRDGDDPPLQDRPARRGRGLAVYGSPQPANDVVAGLPAWLARCEPEFAPGRWGRGATSRLRPARRAAGGAHHSLRAGLATAANRNAQFHYIMHQPRHKSADVARRYIRDADLWKRNVSELVFADSPPHVNSAASQTVAATEPANGAMPMNP